MPSAYRMSGNVLGKATGGVVAFGLSSGLAVAIFTYHSNKSGVYAYGMKSTASLPTFWTPGSRGAGAGILSRRKDPPSILVWRRAAALAGEPVAVVGGEP